MTSALELANQICQRDGQLGFPVSSENDLLYYKSFVPDIWLIGQISINTTVKLWIVVVFKSTVLTFIKKVEKSGMVW